MLASYSFPMNVLSRNEVTLLAGCVILGVSLWLRHDEKTSSLLVLKYEDTEAPNTFYISKHSHIVTVSLSS
ncbi:CD81 molecule a [Tachysurus ichikawai]